MQVKYDFSYQFCFLSLETNWLYIAIHTIPSGVFGGLSIILFGLITVSGARIWVENQVDFKDSRNMLVAGIPGKVYIYASYKILYTG